MTDKKVIVPGTPAIIDLSRGRNSFYTLERNDGKGYLTWEDRTHSETGDDGFSIALIFSDSDKAEKYNWEEIQNTGVVRRITLESIEEFAEKCWAAGTKFCFINFDREKDHNQPIRFDDLINRLAGRSFAP